MGLKTWLGHLAPVVKNSTAAGSHSTRRCFDHNVCISSAHAERADAGDTSLGVGPASHFGQNFDRNFFPRNVRVGRFEIQLTGYLVVFDCQQDFDQAGHPGGGFEVTDVGFD